MFSSRLYMFSWQFEQVEITVQPDISFLAGYCPIGLCYPEALSFFVVKNIIIIYFYQNEKVHQWQWNDLKVPWQNCLFDALLNREDDIII